MDEIVSFVKEILMLSKNDVMPVGLCSFEATATTKPSKKVTNKRKKELRLSELMDR